jgi:hypothetical protein
VARGPRPLWREILAPRGRANLQVSTMHVDLKVGATRTQWMLVWSAAACCRFFPASLLALPGQGSARSADPASWGQQAACRPKGRRYKNAMDACVECGSLLPLFPRELARASRSRYRTQC